MSDQERMLAIAVGNSRVRWGVFEGGSDRGSEGAGDLMEAHSVPNEEVHQLESVLQERMSPVEKHVQIAVISSVNDPVADEVEKIVRRALGCEMGKINRDLGIPLEHVLDEPVTLGVDRALCAFAAWERAKQACVVIDAGTAITVDFVDGQGVFQGGAIVPGGGMMLAAMHGGTEQLPQVSWPPTEAREEERIGRNTPDAMMLGVIAAARGAVRHLVEGYSELYGGYPMVIATGGDAPLFFNEDGLIEHVIPDLQLMGIRLCLAKARSETSE